MIRSPALRMATVQMPVMGFVADLMRDNPGTIVFARKSQISKFRGCGGRHLGEFGGHFEA